MDPNAALQEILRIAKRIIYSRASLDEIDDMAELVINLNDWLSKDGFLPDAWQPKRKQEEIHNPSCDGEHCQCSTGVVRSLPIQEGSNAILCRQCFDYEMQWRMEQNELIRESGSADCLPIPRWEELKVYPSH